jgi:glycosyltransferase involved in cell wall biosynthesis
LKRNNTLPTDPSFGIGTVSSKASIVKLRVGIAASGRFHLLDLARELDALGAEVRFYSYVPRKRAETFGLPGRCHVALLPFLFPLVALERLLPRLFPDITERLMCWALDMVTLLRMRRCEIFICMSGMYVHAPRYAKWRYGARVILHRGSRDILSQRDILGRLPGAQQVTSFIVRRELQGYAIADKIAVPSTQAAESFAPCPEHACKLFLSPYGVDLDQFPLRTGTLPSNRTLLFVGNWSYRKGADVLTKAVERMEGVQLIHVGVLTDADFPNHPQFVHHEPVAQRKLKSFYAAAHVFVLASREEGLALVLCQALASGLPVVCTDRTGGSDLAGLPGLARLIRVVPAGDADALRRALAEALDHAVNQTGAPSITDTERQALGWRRYGLQHLQLMNDMLQPRSSTEPPRSCYAASVALGDATQQ